MLNRIIMSIGAVMCILALIYGSVIVPKVMQENEAFKERIRSLELELVKAEAKHFQAAMSLQETIDKMTEAVNDLSKDNNDQHAATVLLFDQVRKECIDEIK